ncbi:MAG: Pelagibacter phage [Actinomycetota bacterium]|jgi:hypothetical protein
MSRNLMYDELIEDTKDKFLHFDFGDYISDQNLNSFLQFRAGNELYKMKTIYEAKDSDYSENDLPMGNLRESIELGIRPWKGVLLRIGDKKRRIGSFLNKNSFQVKDEAVNDTLIDMANYSFLGCCLFKLDYNPEDFEHYNNLWLQMAFDCVLAKTLFDQKNSISNTELWQSEVWPKILKSYKQLADFALNN